MALDIVSRRTYGTASMLWCLTQDSGRVATSILGYYRFVPTGRWFAILTLDAISGYYHVVPYRVVGEVCDSILDYYRVVPHGTPG